ncbi:hypothetical protein ID866_6642 [Astraeus odoratus]|nr:hypothetical protein ID866_6642 [Astraeus odoratus]
MYANNYAAQSPNPVELSNNPFLNDPSNPYTRFPDISASASAHSPPQQFHSGLGYGDQAHYQAQQYQQQLTPYPGQYQWQPQVQNQSQFASTSPLIPQSTGYGFQPTSAFGQQLQQHAFQTGYHNGQQYLNQGYPPQPNPAYLSEFDPYAPQPTSPNRSQVTGSPAGVAPPGQQHPRDFLRSHKAELESWDSYSWKQLIGACDSLKDAWNVRKQQAERTIQQLGGQGAPELFGSGTGYGYGNPLVEGWDQVRRDAQSNSDTVAACTFQLQEVFNNYRKSGDFASKRRVREACNAAITRLPDWPTPLG